MKIERLNENKIRVVFNNKDLEENNIDLHSFMSNSIETQTLFFNLLDEAEKTLGFNTDNYQIAVETLALSNNYFILTITRLDKQSKLYNQKRVHTSMKLNQIATSYSIYKFDNFDDFCQFCNMLNTSFSDVLLEFENKNSLYLYENNYFFIMNDLTLADNLLNKLCLILTEFSIFIENPKVFFDKLNEFGNIIIENNAVNTCISNF